MEKYKINNLDPLEFEKICCSLLNIRTSMNFRTYKPGTDGGIDIEAYRDGKRYIAQCKRYSDFNKLIIALKKEVFNLDNIDDLDDYYVLTSIDLSPKQLGLIFNIFKCKYMKSSNNIIYGSIIADMLDSPENANILKKYPSLWLYNTNILDIISNKNILIDSEILLLNIKHNEKYYVNNSYFTECIKKLESDNCILIYGLPGVGKTTISSMLVLYLINKYKDKNLKVRYSSISDYKEIKNVISLDNFEFEVILIDDFLGTAYIEDEKKNTNGLISLISYIKLHKNKVLILNSRIGILKTFEEKEPKFERDLKKLGISYVKIGDYSKDEKAKILYRRLVNDVPYDYINELVKYKRYLTIINHINYSPRIIEIVCDFYKKYELDNYYHEVISLLNNPEDIWKYDYLNVLNDYDKVLLTTIYSISNTNSDFELVKEAFWFRIKIKKYNTMGIDVFGESFKKMNESYIKLIIIDNKKCVSMINNSLIDFFYNMEKNNPFFTDELIEESCLPDQLIKLGRWDLTKKCNKENVYYKIDDLLSDSYNVVPKEVLLLLKERDIGIVNEKTYIILSNILFNDNIIIKNYREIVCNYLINKVLGINLEYIDKYIISKLKNDILLFEKVCIKMNYQATDILLQCWEKIDNDSYENSINDLSNIISKCYDEDIKNELFDFAMSRLDDAFDYCKNYDDDGNELIPNENDVEEYLYNKIEEKWYDSCNYIMSDLRLIPNFDYHDFDEIVQMVDVASEIKNYYEPYDHKYEYFEKDDNDENEIERLFSTIYKL